MNTEAMFSSKTDLWETPLIKGKLKFGRSKNNAPFPSMMVIFKPRMEMLEGME